MRQRRYHVHAGFQQHQNVGIGIEVGEVPRGVEDAIGFRGEKARNIRRRLAANFSDPEESTSVHAFLARAIEDADQFDVRDASQFPNRAGTDPARPPNANYDFLS